MEGDLDTRIINQIEYYFGDINLPRDKFLQEKIKEDDGWVGIDVLLTFKRLSNLTTDETVIADALDKSKTKLVLVHEDRKKVRRSPHMPTPELNEERKKELTARTAYAKGFPLDESLDNIVKFLEPHGTIESCQLRNYMDRSKKETKFKGSCFILFKTVEECTKFIEAESIKYKETELIRKWRSVYHEDKKKEYEERMSRKNKNKSEKKETEDEPDIKGSMPGTILYFSGIEPEQQLLREDIKKTLEELSKKEISYIDYSKGLPEGYVRFTKENAAVEFGKTVEEGKVKIGEVELEVKILDGEEEKEYMLKVVADMKERKQRRRFPGKKDRKRKGHFMNDGPRSKR